MKKYYLMAPGPTPVPSNVLLAMAQPMIHHRTPEYEALFIEVRAGLKRLFQTRQEVIPFTSSGTGAMEAAVANTLSAGDTALILRAGKFGERWEEIARAYGITVVPVTAPFGQTVSAEQMGEALRRHPAAKAVLMQHSESSTGVLHDVRGIAGVTRDTGAICVVDAVSSLGIADLPMDAWGADVVVECSGNPRGASGIFEPLCPGGRVVFIGGQSEPIPYDVGAAMVREARVEHVFRYAHVFPRCIAMLSSGAIDVKPLITRTFGFDDSVEAFEIAASAPPGEVKMQIEMPA